MEIYNIRIMLIFPKDEPLQQANQLEVRIEEITQLLNKNKNQLSSTKANLSQLAVILQHSFNCYDQLDFIYQKYAQEDMIQHDPKKEYKRFRQIIKVSKFIFKNVCNWLNGNSSHFRANNQNKHTFQSQLASFKNTCKLCRNGVEEVVLKEAKKEIIGPTHWRQLFYDEILKEDSQLPQRGGQFQRYESSMGHLSRVIQDMEHNLQSYEDVSLNVAKEQNYSEDKAFSLIEELISKMKAKVGERCLPRMNQIIQKQMMKTASNGFKAFKSSSKFRVSGQVSMSLTPTRKKQAVMNRTFSSNHEQTIQKLIEQNKKLTLEKDAASQLYMSANVLIGTLAATKNQKVLAQIAKNKKAKVEKQFMRGDQINEEENEENDNRDSMETQLGKISENSIEIAELGPLGQKLLKENILRVGKVNSFVKSKKQINKLLQRYSSYHQPTAIFRKSDLSCVDRTIYQDIDDVDNQKIIESQAVNVHFDSQEVKFCQKNQQNKKDAECQWSPRDFIQQNSQGQIYRYEDQSKIVIRSTFGVQTKNQFENSNEVIDQNICPTKNSIKLNKSGKKNGSRAGKSKVLASQRIDSQNEVGLKGTTKKNAQIPDKTIKAKDQSKENKTKEQRVIGKSESETNQEASVSKNLNLNIFKHIDSEIIQNSPSQEMISQSRQYLANIDSLSVLPAHSIKHKNSEPKMNARQKSNQDLQRHVRKVNFNMDVSNGQERHTLGHTCQLKRDNFQGKRLKPILERGDSEVNSSQHINTSTNINTCNRINDNCQFYHLNKLDNYCSTSKEFFPRNINTSNSKKPKFQDYFKNRIATEGNQRQYIKRAKKVRNVLFQPEHLSIFGGVSESYQYQSLPIDLNEENLSQNEKDYYSRLTGFISNLKGFKRNMYQNIVVFLQNPFDTIEKLQQEYHPDKNNIIKQLVLRLLLFHKKKCSSIECSHVKTFSQIVGFSTNFFN